MQRSQYNRPDTIEETAELMTQVVAGEVLCKMTILKWLRFEHS
jgi:hypothetical protein